MVSYFGREKESDFACVILEKSEKGKDRLKRKKENKKEKLYHQQQGTSHTLSSIIMHSRKKLYSEGITKNVPLYIERETQVAKGEKRKTRK